MAETYNEMQSLTLNGKKYDSFRDQTARQQLEELKNNGSDSTQNAGVHIGPEPPADTSVLWIDTSDDTEDEDPLAGYYTGTETDAAIKSYVDTALGVIENGSY